MYEELSRQTHVGPRVSGVGGAAFIRTARQGRWWWLDRVRDCYNADGELADGDGWRRQRWDLQSHNELLVGERKIYGDDLRCVELWRGDGYCIVSDIVQRR